ncbi:MAG: hypothetical protein HKM00_04105 [Gallionella sp.]|jgi:hypothetical protein|nr:hypothetical protein [Gallionella sp.]
MLILRFALVVIVLLIALSGGMYVLTRDPRYYRFAWQVVRFGVLLFLVFGLLFLLERYVLVGWRVLL